MLKSWPVRVLHSGEELCRQAAKFKAKHRISLADAYIAATAKLENAQLLHKDPEFEALEGQIDLCPLPYK